MAIRNSEQKSSGLSIILAPLVASGLVLGLAASTGCESIAEQVITKPRLVLDHVDVRDVTVSGAVVVFRVMVDNPNPFGINVSKLTYDVEIAGRALTNGVMDKGISIPANQNSRIEIPVPVRFSDVFTSAFDVLKKGTSTYRVRGAAAIGPFNLPFDETGDIKLTQ